MLKLLRRLWRTPRPLIGSVCDGCDDDRPLTKFDNGKNYCFACAVEVEARGWAKPVGPPTHRFFCRYCGEPIAVSWTADDPPISFSMHRCEKQETGS